MSVACWQMLPEAVAAAAAAAAELGECIGEGDEKGYWSTIECRRQEGQKVANFTSHKSHTMPNGSLRLSGSKDRDVQFPDRQSCSVCCRDARSLSFEAACYGIGRLGIPL